MCPPLSSRRVGQRRRNAALAAGGFVEAFYGCRSPSSASSRAASGSCGAARPAELPPDAREDPRHEGNRQASRVATLVVGGIVVLALALWELKLLAALLFFAFILAAAMRPTVERSRARHPARAGIALHYVVLLGLIAASSGRSCRARSTRSTRRSATSRRPAPISASRREDSTGIRHDILVGIQRRLEDLPSGESLVDPAVEVTLTVFEVALGIFFVLASAAYWIFERDRAEDLALLAPAAAAAEEGAGHVEPDRREARRLRARPGAADRARRDRALARVLGDRAALLAPGRRLRRESSR